MHLDTILTYVSWHMTDTEGGPSRVAPTASERRRRVEDLSRVQGEASHVTTEHFIIDSIVSESVPNVKPTAVSSAPTPRVPRASKDTTLLENYSTHVTS